MPLIGPRDCEKLSFFKARAFELLQRSELCLYVDTQIKLEIVDSFVEWFDAFLLWLEYHFRRIICHQNGIHYTDGLTTAEIYFCFGHSKIPCQYNSRPLGNDNFCHI